MALSGRLPCGVLSLLVLIASTAVARADAPPEATPPLPTEVRFDPAAMPDVAASKAPLGFRYATLSQQQTKALRRGFKLPLDALISAKSPNDLLGAAKIAPLPDTNQPLLSVPKTDALGSANPFVSARATSFRSDPMKALGEMLAAVDGVDPSEEPVAASNDPFAGDAALSPATEADSSAATGATSAADSEDPFAADEDPFGGGEDPFGDF